MEWKAKPRNENITIRVTKEEKHEFKEIANTNCVSESNWAYHILKKHKNSYGKTENIDQLLDVIENLISDYEFFLEALRNQKRRTYSPLFELNDELAILRFNIVEKLLSLSKLKNQIEKSKYS